MDNTVIQALTFAIALLGAVLGVINTWRAVNNDRVRVRLTASHGVTDHGAPCILLTAVNLSTFPVTVTHIGFDRNDGPSHMQIPRPMFTQRETLPVRLEARANFTVVVPLSAMEQSQLATLRRAYLRTACGRKVCSSTAVCRQVANAARARD